MITLPAIRWGQPYESLEVEQLAHFLTGDPVARVNTVGAGIIRRDARQANRARDVLRSLSPAELIERCQRAGELFEQGTLTVGDSQQTPADFVAQTSATTGMPLAMVQANVTKNAFVLKNIEQILAALTRGLDLEILTRGYGDEGRGVTVSYQAQTDVLGAVLPSNSPGVHTLWLPVIALQIGLALKPGSQEPWTPFRVAAAMTTAGIPEEAISIYPGAGAELGGALLASCRRSMIFGGPQTVDQYAGNHQVQVHGPGYSKILLGDDVVDEWPRYVDLLTDSVYRNGGRSCINCSSIYASRHTAEIADALAAKLGPIEALPPDDPQAGLAAFTTPHVAPGVWQAIERFFESGAARHATANYGPRLIQRETCDYLRPTVLECNSPESPAANIEYMFPLVSVVRCPQADMLARIGPTLVCTAITNNESFRNELIAATQIDRLNLGPIPTPQVDWLQPHEGNLIEFLYRSRPPGIGNKLAPPPPLMNGLMNPANIQSATRVEFGAGKVAALGEFARELGVKRVLVASDPGVIAAGHTGRGIDSLTTADLDFHLFDGVQENPTTDNVEAGLTVARKFQPDLIVGLGGGSSMDCAKGINFLYSCGGRMQDYWGIGKATGPLLPMIAVPTTAGTGSETQSFALISDAETHVKMACGDKRAAFRVAILDPELTLTQPPRVAALAGFDALSHAVETFVTKKRNEVSCDFSRRAWQELAPHYLRVLQEPNDIQARGHMQMGACLAGSAIENSMLGAAHALANPLTATYGIAHGEAVALMLPHVVRFNGRQCEIWYRELLASASDELNCPHGGAVELADFLWKVASEAGMPDRLESCGVEHARLPYLADAAACQWTATFNPIPVGRDELLKLYEEAY